MVESRPETGPATSRSGSPKLASKVLGRADEAPPPLIPRPAVPADTMHTGSFDDEKAMTRLTAAGIAIGHYKELPYDQVDLAHVEMLYRRHPELTEWRTWAERLRPPAKP